MPRTGATILTMALAAFVSSRPGRGCTVTFDPVYLERHLGAAVPLPSNAQFHIWGPPRSIVSVDLLDSGLRPVPLAVEVVPVFGYWAEIDPGQLTILRPFRDLTPGRYRLVYGQHEPGTPLHQGQTYVITDERPTLPPPAPLDARAQLVVEQCARDLGANCSPRFGDCELLRVDFRQPEGHWDRSLLYQLAWWPETAAGADATRGGVLRGLVPRPGEGPARVLRVPTARLDGMRGSDARVGLELVAIDHAGHRSAAIRASAEVGSFLRDHPVEPAWRSAGLRPLDRRYAEDVARFERAAAPEARELFARLAPPSVAPPGRDHDRAFARAVLEPDGQVSMIAHLRGPGSRVGIGMTMRISGGAVHPPVSATGFAELVSDLPIEDAALKSLHLDFRAGSVSASVKTAEWGSFLEAVKIGERHALRQAWERHLAAVDRLTRHPLYRSLLEAHGGPLSRSADTRRASASFGGSPFVPGATISTGTLNGVLEGLRLSCLPEACRTGDVAPVVAAVERAMGGELHRVDMEIAPDGFVRIWAYPTGKPAARFEGRLGQPEVRPPAQGRVPLDVPPPA